MGAPANPAAVTADQVLQLPIAEVRPGANARGALGDVDALAMSIQAVGQLQPVLVEADPAGGWVLYDGHRRHAALVKLRAATIRAVVVRPAAGAHRAIRQVAMHALAAAFDPIAESDAIHALYWGEHLREEEIARIVGHTPGWVRDRLALRVLNDSEKAKVTAGRMSLAEAMGIVRRRRAERYGRPAPAPIAAGLTPSGQPVQSQTQRLRQQLAAARAEIAWLLAQLRHDDARARVAARYPEVAAGGGES